ncbi:MAG: hypothetical protein KDC98_11895 [Planctomycetes bacterium]|nr:hypothetical protein [Planctomycetota bacterium]
MDRHGHPAEHPLPLPPRLQSPPLPGSRRSCALLTVLTILLVWPTDTPALRVIVLPAYFALLSWFFWTTGRGLDSLPGQPMNLVRWGFLVLWLGFTTSGIVHFAELDVAHATFAYLREACENGALFLLGVTLIAYGLMLWIPRVIEANELLSRNLDQRASELVVAATARDELEHRLLEADRRAILGELAASIAHDLRNPLAIVVGTAESLCRKQRTADEIAEHTDVIRRNIDKADRTLDSLIDLGRPRARQLRTIVADEVAADVIAMVRTEARRRGITLEIAADRRQPMIFGDRNLLAQALLNLVLNAMQAAAEGTLITVRARPLFGGSRRSTVIAVEDRGPGVPRPLKMRAFEPFHTTKPDGTGLGLWSCRRIAEELGGDMAIYPRHRGGARVLMSMPAEQAADAAPKEPGSRTDPSSSRPEPCQSITS